MEVFKAIASVVSEIGSIGKNKKNAQQGWKFRGIDDVYNTLNPLLGKHGLFTVPEVLELSKEERTTARGGVLIYATIKMQYTVYAKDGSSVKGIVYGEAMDSGDKAINKAMSIAHKYFYFQLFSIPTEDQPDADSEVHNPQPKIGQLKAQLFTEITRISTEESLSPSELLMKLGYKNGFEDFKIMKVEEINAVLTKVSGKKFSEIK